MKSFQPDKLDTLLMMIDEMGIKLIDESDIGEFTAKGPKPRPKQAPPADAEPKPTKLKVEEDLGEEEIDLNLEAELAEASTKRIDDPVRMYLTQMGEIPLLTREQEIGLAKKIEITRKIFRSAKSSKAITAFRARSTFFSRWMTAICRSTAR